jgi:cytosine/uracil/thiamine/allantoin permease
MLPAVSADFSRAARSPNRSQRRQNDNTLPALFFDSMVGVCYGAEVSKILHHLRG